MGKFINKSYVNTIDALQQGQINRVKNANYVFNDKNPVVADWYNMSVRGTTFDEGTRAEYADLSHSSPIRYNKITGAVFYSSGIKLSMDVDFNEEGLGLASQPAIAGVVLPNTWIPYAGDYFSIQHAGKEWLYKVTATSFDTIDNGNNVYSFEAQLDNYGIEEIEKQVVDRFKFVINNVGTEFNAVIKEEDYNAIDNLDTVLTQIKKYFVALFFKENLQTFVYPGQYGDIYDPYMIEFLMKNSILSGSDPYVYVSQAIQVPASLILEYDKTFFRALETKSLDRFSNQPANISIIEDIYSLFHTTLTKYFKVSYTQPILNGGYTILDPLMISDAKENVERDFKDERALNNIITRYFNNGEFNSDIIKIYEAIDFKPTPYLFYAIPMTLYCIECQIRNLMSRSTS